MIRTIALLALFATPAIAAGDTSMRHAPTAAEVRASDERIMAMVERFKAPIVDMLEHSYVFARHDGGSPIAPRVLAKAAADTADLADVIDGLCRRVVDGSKRASCDAVRMNAARVLMNVRVACVLRKLECGE
jgi:hypothetical protein